MILSEDSGVSTDPYIQLTLSRVTKKDFRGEIQTVAVAYNQMYDGIDIDVAKNARTVAYETRNEALQAVKDGTVDACYVYTCMAEKFVNQDLDGELTFHIVDMPSIGLSFTIRPTTNHELISILNKCMKADQTFVMDELVEKYTHYEQRLIFTELNWTSHMLWRMHDSNHRYDGKCFCRRCSGIS